MSQYIAMFLNDSDARKLYSVTRMIGIKNPIPPDEMHMTLMYDERENTPEFTPDTELTVGFTPSHIGLLGDALVLFIDSPDAEDEHKRLKSLGYQHSFETFLPHISLVYEPSVGDTEKMTRYNDYLSNWIDVGLLVDQYGEDIEE